MSGRESKNNFIMQAGILAVAGIISRIIGLLYRGPLHSVIGDLGLGYYQSAYNFYTIVLLISSYSIPAAISKVIAQKLGVREYRNAHRIFLCSMLYVLPLFSYMAFWECSGDIFRHTRVWHRLRCPRYWSRLPMRW